MRRVAVLGLLLAVGGLSLGVAAMQPAGIKVPDIYKVKENLYVIGGSQPEIKGEFSGGNTAVWIGEKGVIVVDQKNPGWGQTILGKIRTVTNKPVIMALNSHGHNDHAGSITELGPSVEMVVHENIRAMWAQEKCTNVGNCDQFRGEKKALLPKRTFKDTLTLFGGPKDQIDLFWFGRAHTNGDTWVVFRTAAAVHVGDLYRPKVPPFIDIANGASGVEFPETLAKGVAGIGKVDTVIPGHGPIMTFADLQLHRDYMRDFVDYVKAGKKAGRSVDEMAKAYVVKPRFKGYLEGPQADPVRVKDDIQIIYDELE
jgi:glyoxylase-like metal-dependent hydrolase (beta-lactamase superfamily II)